MAGLDVGVPVIVGLAVDVGAGLGLQVDLLGGVLAIGAEGEDALGLITGDRFLIAGVQGHIRAAVVEAGGVVDLDVLARVGVDALGLVLVGDGVFQHMGTGHIGAAHLEAVAVARVQHLGGGVHGQGAVFVAGDGGKGPILGGAARRDLDPAVAVGHRVADGGVADGAGGHLGEEVPAVVGVVGGDTAVKDVAHASRDLGGKAVGILHFGVGVVDGVAVQNGVVAGPFFDGLRRRTRDLQAGVAVVVEVHPLDGVVAAGDLHPLGAVGGVGDVEETNVPVVAPQLEAGTGAAKVQRRIAAVALQGDGLVRGAAAAAGHFEQGAAHVVAAGLEQNGLACSGVVEGGLEIDGVLIAGAAVGALAGRSGIDGAAVADGADRDRLFHHSGVIAVQNLEGRDLVAGVGGKLHPEGGVPCDGVCLGELGVGGDVHAGIHQRAVLVHVGHAVSVGLEHQGIAVLGGGGRTGDLVIGRHLFRLLGMPAGSVPGAGGEHDVGVGDVHAAGGCKAHIAQAVLDQHGVVQLVIAGNSLRIGVLGRNIEGVLAEDRAGGAVGVDGVLGDDVGIVSLFQADAVGVALLDGRAVGVEALAVDLQRVAVHGGQVADAGVAADAHHVLDLGGAIHPVVGQLGAGDGHQVGLKAGALAFGADDVPDHQGKALLTVGSGVDVVDGDVGLQVEIFLGRVDGGVVEADAVGRVGRDELAALFVDGAVGLRGAGRHDDLAVDAVGRADGVGRLTGGRAKPGK